MDDFFTSEEKKELFFTLQASVAICRRYDFLEDCQKLKKHLIKAAQCNGLQRTTRDESRHQRFTNGGHRSRRNRHERFVSDRHHASRNSEGTYPVYRRSECRIWRRCRQYHQRPGEKQTNCTPKVRRSNRRISAISCSLCRRWRVILIMIADRVNIMRQIKDTGNEEDRAKVANEAAYLYAPLAPQAGTFTN